jgi:hypothetical protein
LRSRARPAGAGPDRQRRLATRVPDRVRFPGSQSTRQPAG